MMRMVGLLLIGCCCALSACKKKPPEESTGEAEAAERPAEEPKVAFDKYATHFDLWEHAHLAEVDHHGLYIQFGAPTRHKYTYGNWRSGFGADGSRGPDTYSVVASDTARVNFRVDRAGPMTLRLRLRPVGTAVVTAYLNGEALPSLRLSGDGFGDHDVAIPAERLKDGENRLLLRFGGTTEVNGQKVSAELASIRLAEGTLKDAAKSFTPPRLSELRTEVSVGGEQRRALAVRPSTRLSYYVVVPEGGKLGFGVGVTGDEGQRATARVLITPEGAVTKELFSAKLSSSWRDQLLALDAYAGKVVRLDFLAEGDVGPGLIAWSEPALLLEPKELGEQPKVAKNVVVLLIDTMRARSLAPFVDKTRVQTPTLDTVAKEGAVMEAAQAPENWTKPSPASVLTGLFPATHNTKTDGAKLPARATMLSEALKEAGFKTGSFIANGYVSDKFGFKQGWDHYTNYIRERKSTEAENVFKEAGDWIEKHKDERFFAYVHTIDPHVPYDPPDEFLRKYKKAPYQGQVSPRKTADLLAGAKKSKPSVIFTAADKQELHDLYDGEVSYHDHYFGLFINRLKKLGLYEDTLLVITSDHGEEFDEHGAWGHGHSVYQELIWVPYIVRFPDVVAPGTRIPETVSTMTIFPTVLEALGLAPSKSVEDHSLLPRLRGAPPAPVPVAFSDFLDDRRVIRAGRWKLILRGTAETFFDLESDPLEQKELDRSRYPVAARYTSIVLGQFLGATDRRVWLSGEAGRGMQLDRENANIDQTLRDQLKAIGYAGDEPAADTH